MTRTHWIVVAVVAAVALFAAANVGAEIDGLPDVIEVPPNEPCALTASALGTVVTWDAPTLADVSVDDAGTLHFRSGATGAKDKVTAKARQWFTQAAIERVVTVSVVGKTPLTGLPAKLRQAYDGDSQKPFEKRQQKLSLVSIYEAAIVHARNPKLQTAGQLLADIHSSSVALLPKEALHALRELLADVIAAELGSDPLTRLDDAVRDKAVRLFGEIIHALKEVG